VFLMENEPHPSHIEAGRIAARVLKEVKAEVKPGKTVISICTLAEKKIIEYGARPAFPCNVSIGNIAAHYTSPPGDTTTIPDFGLVKVDLGAQVDGYLVDTATTVDIDGTLEGFVAATDDALGEAIAAIRPGVAYRDIGAIIEKVIKAYGLRPISNLTGHDIKRYVLHGGKRIPNVKTRDVGNFELGETYAIEPYATSGVGTVVDSNLNYIFANNKDEVPLDGVFETLRKHLRNKYGPLPFASRWIGTKAEDFDVVKGLCALLKARAIRSFPVQVSKKGRPVSQSEHTIFVGEDLTTVLTNS
jgi:methionyl aminopeptidase